jgi:hypothetical protein
MQRRNFVRAAFLGIAAAFSGSGLAASRKKSDSAATDITAEITALLRRTEEIWDSQQTERLLDLWDTDDPDPFYLAGEQENWFVGWDAINAYLDPPPGSPKITQAIRVRFYDIQARLLAPDLAFAAYWMRTDMKLVFQEKPFGSDNRVATVFRKKADGWRYVCYNEAFQAPNMYMQKLFEMNVSPEYGDFFEKTMRRK